MLADLKSFVLGSSVAEVGVGLSIGAAFTAVVAQATDAGSAAVRGELEVAGLGKALVALLVVALVSLVGVIKPLTALRRRAAAMVGSQDEPGTPEAVAVTDAPTAAVDVVAPAATDVAASATSEVDEAELRRFVADPLNAPLPVPAGSVNDVGSVVLSRTAASYATSTVPPAAVPADLATSAPVVVDLTTTEAATGAGDEIALARPTAGSAAVLPAQRSAGAPFVASALTTCPHCAFEVPAVATRCGWCTSTLQVVAVEVAAV